MSRKDYIAIASALASVYATNGAFPDEQRAIRDNTLSVAANCLADVFAQDNPRFDRETFMHVVFGV